MYSTYNTTFNISLLYALFILYTHIYLLIIDYRVVYVDSYNSMHAFMWINVNDYLHNQSQLFDLTKWGREARYMDKLLF